MMTATLTIAPIDPRAASDREYAALADYKNRIRAEQRPDDPPLPLDEQIRGWRNIPPFADVREWAVWDAAGETIVAGGSTVLLRLDENRHVADCNIDVLPEFRRQGLARRLLALVAEAARRDDRRLLMFNTTDRVPAGEAFMRRLGARKALEGHTNQLDLAGLDRALLADWLERARGLEERFAIGLWSGPYPESDLAAIAGLYEILNQQPHGDLEVEDFRFTPELVRQLERQNVARGAERWTLYVRERATGAFAGFTELFWHPNRPAILDQGATGVFPRYRNGGLGRWLKASMLDRALRERPQARFVRTGNADANAPMLKINRELGFEPYIARATWQIETDKALAYANGAAVL